MTKPLSSFPQSERFAVANRRKNSKSGGLGYWSAIDALAHFGKAKETKEKVKETISE